MNIIQNNYSNQNKVEMKKEMKKIVKKVGYEVVCQNCKSVIRITKKDIDSGCRPHEESWRCPCCNSNQYLGQYKKVNWLEEV